MRKRIRIGNWAAVRAGHDGRLEEEHLCTERRSKKVGALPLRARMVLRASLQCIGGGVTADARQADDDRAGLGVSLGTLFGSMDVAEQCLTTVHREGFASLTPSWYAAGLPNAVAAIVASIHDLKGPNLTALGYQSGIEAIILGSRQILTGKVRSVLAGGFDLPTESFSSRLLSSPPFSGVQAIHPGVGLLSLSEEMTPAPGTSAIVGWSRGLLDRSAQGPSEDMAFRHAVERLVEASAEGVPLDKSPSIHWVYPSQRPVDYLAATGPLCLIEEVLASDSAGVHALLIQGFDAPVWTCLLVEKRPGTAAVMSC